MPSEANPQRQEACSGGRSSSFRAKELWSSALPGLPLGRHRRGRWGAQGGGPLTVERLRHLQDAFTKAAADSRARADCYAEQDDADAVHPVRQDDQRAHPRRSPDRTAAGRPATECTRCRGCAPTMPGIHSTE
ncbi:hypothetical protein [Streptomyces sp. NPDC002550]